MSIASCLILETLHLQPDLRWPKAFPVGEMLTSIPKGPGGSLLYRMQWLSVNLDSGHEEVSQGVPGLSPTPPSSHCLLELRASMIVRLSSNHSG